MVEIRRLRAEGLIMREIADRFGVHTNTVYKILSSSRASVAA